MPADKEEIDALVKEGIEIIELTAPLSVEKKNGKLELTSIRMELSDKDASGRRRPVPVKGSEFVLAFDNILTAIGQDIDLNFLTPETFEINKATLETNLPNILIGGDAVRGADSLINAVGDGKKAAIAIAKKANEDFVYVSPSKDKKIDLVDLQKRISHREFGVEIVESPLSTPKNFELVHPTLTPEEAVKEAQRCFFCDDVCNICTTVCPNFANITFDVTPMDIPVYALEVKNGTPAMVQKSAMKITQEPQIINVRDFCNECGNCDSFCPTSGAPYKTKPKFNLTKESFDAEKKGYMLENNKLIFKKDDVVSSLAIADGTLVYESPAVKATFSSDTFAVKEFLCTNAVSESVDLKQASEMYLLLKNLADFPLFRS